MLSGCSLPESLRVQLDERFTAIARDFDVLKSERRRLQDEFAAGRLSAEELKRQSEQLSLEVGDLHRQRGDLDQAVADAKRAAVDEAVKRAAALIERGSAVAGAVATAAKPVIGALGPASSAGLGFLTWIVGLAGSAAGAIARRKED
jgi:hypothetical protein